MLQYELDQITIKCFFQMTTFEPSSKYDGKVSKYPSVYPFHNNVKEVEVWSQKIVLKSNYISEIH